MNEVSNRRSVAFNYRYVFLQGIPLETEYDELVLAHLRTARILNRSLSLDDVACHFLLRVTELDSVTGERIVKSVGTIRGVAPDAYPTMQRYKLSRYTSVDNF